MPDLSCPLCNSRSKVLLDHIPGYQSPQTYSILRCPNCDTNYSADRTVPDGLYEAIYRNAKTISGYDRYYAYAERVLLTAEPLNVLAETEDMYWFIATYLRERTAGTNPKILEIGSGLGYLTYAISRSGYDVKGMDLSSEAVNAATQRFGDRFFRADLFEYCDQAADMYDIVIMTEVLEHVPDPIAFIDAMRKLIRPGGVLLVTTPNKSTLPADTIWDSDAPPVHLWWYSESSIRQMAIRAGLSIDFWDFTRFNRRRIGRIPKSKPTEGTPFQVLLDEQGNPTKPATASLKQRLVRRMRAWVGEAAVAGGRDAIKRAVGSRSFLRRRGHLLLSRSTSMGIILKRED